MACACFLFTLERGEPVVSIDRLPGKIERPDKERPAEIHKERLDLVVLQSMVRRMAGTLHAAEQSTETILPLAYSFEGLRRRLHRMLIFAPHKLFAVEEMRFVGFVSKRNPAAEQQVIAAILRADELMLAEIAHIPGLLSYSSLEIHPRIWYNLVLFRGTGVKIYVKSGETHRHAVYQLSPAYYEWIRLHNGTLSGGIACPEWRLKTTKHYRFSGPQHPPVVRELQYETDTSTCQEGAKGDLLYGR